MANLRTDLVLVGLVEEERGFFPLPAVRSDPWASSALLVFNAPEGVTAEAAAGAGGGVCATAAAAMLAATSK